MPIPLGILAAAGFSPAVAGGSFDLIETVTVGSGGASSVTFSNLNTYASTYQHLQVRWVGRNTNGEAGGVCVVQLNGDTASDYSWHRLEGNGSSVSSAAGTSTTSMLLGRATTAGDTSNSFGVGVIDVLDAYETGKFKTLRGLSGQVATYNGVLLASGNWRDTAAITSLTLLPNGGTNWVQYSRFSIYGVK